MHKYLRAIGISNCNTNKAVEKLICHLESKAEKAVFTKINEVDSYKQTYTRLGRRIGISSCGMLDDENKYYREFYFPYLNTNQISTNAECEIQRHAEKESYSGMCEEYKLGISLIFYMQNSAEYLKRTIEAKYSTEAQSVMLCGLSLSGSIILPVRKTVRQAEKIRIDNIKRSMLFEAAKQGSEDAIETLTLEDMDVFAKVNGRVENEDIYSIVDTSFMPYGVECDHYSIIGEIIEIEKDINTITNEEIYILTIECNTMVFPVCINKNDLIGEPDKGRRFKGIIWMQGVVNFVNND